MGANSTGSTFGGLYLHIGYTHGLKNNANVGKYRIPIPISRYI